MNINYPLVKYLVSAGVGSRRKSASLIMDGCVYVNNEQILSINYSVNIGDAVKVNGLKLNIRGEEKIYLLVNKPKGYLSAVNDPRGRKTVLDLVPKNFKVPGLVPAGRLDLFSSGLMILSNDGDFVNRVTHPRYQVEKEYEVLLDSDLSNHDMKRLINGIRIESGKARVQSINAIDSTYSLYNLVLLEGKKREIRLLMMALGKKVRNLKRIRIGNFELGELGSGSTMRLSDAQVKQFNYR